MIPSEFDLTGRVALVTGGSAGIGRATALLLAERGANVAVCGRRKEPLDKATAAINALGKQGFGVIADVSIPESAASATQSVIAHFGRLDILINNAGGAHRHVALAKMDVSGWQRDVNLNLNAAMYCSQAALPALRKQGGAIVNISSLAGVHGTQGVAAYSAAKAGVQMFTRVSSAEWGPLGIRVNCVAPGMIATEAARRGWEKSGFDAMGACQAFPLRRYGEMREVAEAIVFLASDAASYITGETLTVGGGPQIGGMIRTDD